MKKKKNNLKLSSFFATLNCLLLGLLLSTAILAQKTNKPVPPPPNSPSDCTQGCTSNDVQIQNAYLSNAAGVRLSDGFVCPASGTAQVYLTLELTTNTPRVGVTIYTKIKNFTPPSTIGSEVTGSPVKQCFGLELNQPLNRVTFSSPFTWTCNTAIVLTDIFIGWGTGNTNFCTSNSFQCPATPSKCYSLPPGSFVAIETPQPLDDNDAKCSDQPGGTTATFNLTGLNVTSSSNVTITWWENYTAPSTFSGSIGTPGAYSSSSKNVYAKITSNADATVFSVSTVTLTVNQKPNLAITNPLAVCSPATLNLNAASIVAGSTLPGTITWSFSTASDGSGPVANPAAVGNGTFYIKATTNTTPACSDTKAVVITVNTTPSVPSATVIQPTCETATGSITVNSPDGTVTYTLTDPSPATTTHSNNSGVFSGLAPGTYGLTASKNGCTSGSVSKTVNPVPSNPSFTVCLVQPTLCANSGSVTVNATGGSGFTYKLNNGAPQGSNVFNNLASGSVTSITVTNSDGCSATVSCLSLVESCVERPTGARISTPQQIESSASTTTVKAYPNPFSDRVKFMVTSTVAGNGNLEVYNMMGQKVKTVYQGYIAKGTQTFELSLPKQNVGNLVYVLRIGDKKMTGKILQLNQ